ncbi:MAG TPA: hypothetical protein VGL57_01855 [Solirubrobacteraceae bacterium]|jgi:hypothetical protein
MRIAACTAAPLLLIGVLAWPLLFTEEAFNADWVNHFWFMWHQSLAIRSGHTPSLFVNYSHGVFYPWFAFYGGTLYALAGALSLALGNAPLETYVLTYLLGFAAAYGGWYWMARMFGLRSWPAHIPGLIFVTSAAYLTILYALGDWPEFTAVSAMPLLIASALSVLRTSQVTFWPAAALAGSGVVFFGSHLLTEVWGTTLVLLLALALLACVPEIRRSLTRASVARTLGLLIPALLVSAWFLLPALAYESQTVIAHTYPHFRELLKAKMFTVAAPHLFTLSRARVSGTILTLALPVLAIAWALGSIAVALAARRRGLWMKVLLALTGATALLLVLMTHATLILALPRVYSTLQFSFRLESYVLLGVSGMLLAALVLTGDGGPWLLRWRWLLAPIAALAILGAIEQVDAHTTGSNRAAVLRSFRSPAYAQEALLDYVDDQLPIMRTPLPKVYFPPSTAPGEHAVVVTHLGRRRLLDTNLRSAPGFLHIQGARIVATDAHADDIVEVDRAPSAGRPVRIVVATSESLPIAAGRILSIAALLILGVELALIALRRDRTAGTEDPGTIPHRL